MEPDRIIIIIIALRKHDTPVTPGSMCFTNWHKLKTCRLHNKIQNKNWRPPQCIIRHKIRTITANATHIHMDENCTKEVSFEVGLERLQRGWQKSLDQKRVPSRGYLILERSCTSTCISDLQQIFWRGSEGSAWRETVWEVAGQCTIKVAESECN